MIMGEICLLKNFGIWGWGIFHKNIDLGPRLRIFRKLGRMPSKSNFTPIICQEINNNI
jgi:hypothetical protein